jgi:hypothetical protein
VARAYDAQCTPDFFLYDGQGKLVYRGQLDDSRPGNDVPDDRKGSARRARRRYRGPSRPSRATSEHRLQHQMEMNAGGMTRVVQLQQGSTRRVARVDEPSLRLLADTESVFALAGDAIDARVPLKTLIDRRVTSECLDYDAVYSGSSPWRLLVPIDHPEPSRCLISGTGLTHLGSAESRHAMHGKSDSELTDSMRMFRMGLEGGRPDGGSIGAAPEWFYKGNGTVLRTTGDVLEVPGYAEDGGDEAEVAGVYVVDAEGRPRRIGMAAGNEFSDHKFEKRNYLNLAGSKLRTCGLGPELVIDPAFDLVPGRVSVERAGQTICSARLQRRARDVSHRREHRASSLQVRGAPAAR